MTYLQPAADSLCAYIFPMSPMPMRPTTKFSMPAGRASAFDMADDGGVIARSQIPRQGTTPLDPVHVKH